MKVPFLDLKAQYMTIKEDIDNAIEQVVDSCAFAGGHFVEKFEKEFAAFCHSNYAIGVGSGTEALWLTLLSLGIGADDEVITVPNTFIATAEAISLCGARPVFVDIDKKTYTLDPAELETSITPRTKAVIPVHLYGQMANMDEITEISRNHGLFVIEDACQAHGAEYKGCRAGNAGDVACFSFYPGKNLGAIGEAGAVVTNNSELAEKILNLRDHGQSEKYHHDMIGCNARMDGIQGAVLSTKLKHLEKWNNARRKNAEKYEYLLKAIDGIELPFTNDFSKHVYHIYAIRVNNRDALIKALNEKDIQCGIHYPIPIHLQEAYRSLGLLEGSFAVTERCAQELVSLPMFPELSSEQITYVTNEIKRFYTET